MISKTELLHDIELPCFEPPGINVELSVRNHLLYSEIRGDIHAIACQQFLVEASNHYSKLAQKFPLILVDDASYEQLYKRFLELRTDRSISLMHEEGNNERIHAEDALDLAEFLRTSSDILTSEESAPIIKFVNALFYQAVKKKASDIHIEMHEHHATVRFRIDGILQKNVDLEKKVINLIVSRIKVISNLDISEKRIPQDGRTEVRIAGKVIDVRVSVLPTFYGERVVMRLLTHSHDIPSIDELGFGNIMTKDIKKLLRASHGIILVTGPTGSGKTTSLHSFLREISSPDINIITVEDPVEYKSESISQIQIHEKIGLTFASALRSILRQDPDVIMIGEIRDTDTANIAVRAALTGHLVFSTLHTNSAAATLSRLADMGIPPFLISSALLGVLAQRLVRILCDDCKEEDKIAEEFINDYKLPADTVIYKSKGCNICNHSGYISRQSLGEFLIIDDEVKELLKVTTDEHAIDTKLVSNGLQTIKNELINMLLEGRTSLDEAIRIGLGNR
jgi:general secretion pathway protein E